MTESQKPSQALAGLKNGRWVAVAVSILSALVFLVGAIGKLLAIDDFELYIYSFGIFSLNASFILARLCIGAELLLSAMLLSGYRRPRVILLSILVLIAFSLFLCYALLIGRTDSCHCMGRFANLSPAVSLLKNALLIVISLLGLRFSSQSRRHPTKHLTRQANSQQPTAQGQQPSTCLAVVLSAILAAVLLATPFVVSVPDNWAFGPSDTRFNRPLLEATLAENHLPPGNHLVALVTPGCPYCQMTRQKIGSMVLRNHLPDNKIHYIQPNDIGLDTWMRITLGQRPLIATVSDGQVVSTFHYRNLNEHHIVNFLRQ